MVSHPKTYKAAQIQEKGGKFQLIDVPWKDPEEHQVVVKVLACGVCHSDSAVVTQAMPTGLPRIPGHEIVGEVAVVGSQVKRWKAGDRVGSGWHGGHCFACKQCDKGDFVTCENENINGIITDGGYGEYVTLREEALLSVPTDIEPALAAPLLCAGVTVYNSLRHQDVHPGDVVAVQGVGGLGHLAIQFASAMGFKTVALSTSASKEKLAKDLGAHVYVDGSKVSQVEALKELGGAKVIIAVAPSGKAMSELLEGLAVDGTLLTLAIAEPLTVPPVALIQKRASVKGWPSGSARDSQDTLEFAQQSGIKTTIETFPLAKVQEAYEHMMSGKVRFRCVLVM